MSDVRTLLRAVDEVRAPDLWAEISARALAPAPAPPVRRPRLAHRLVPVAAALVAIVTAVVTLVPRAPSAFAIVRDAIQDFASIPPFRATIVGPAGPSLLRAPSAVATFELSYRGADAWRLVLDDVSPRSAAPPGALGSFDLWDGERRITYDAASNTYTVTPVLEGFSPLGFLSWDQGGGIAFWKERCGREGSEILGNEAVAGRAARHVRCGELELWIDAETGLMLKIRSNQPRSAQPEPFPGPIGLLPGTSVEIKSIEYNPAFPEGIFRFSPPPGAKQVDVPPEEQEGEPRPPIIDPGTIAPAWRRPLLAGGELGTDDLRGKPSAVYFWATWCYVCGGDRLDVLQSAFRAYGDRLNVVSVAVNDERGALEDTVARGRYGFPVVLDEDEGAAEGRIAEMWRLRGIPSLVLLDAEGRVVAVVTDRGITADELQGYLDAFAQGRPLPSSDRG